MAARSVLIVDDHVEFRSTAKRLLESEGYRVVGEAADGTTGLAAALDLRPDVVLLDVMLPDVNGFEIAEELALRAAKSLVVMISSRDASTYRTKLANSRAQGFIFKGDLTGEALRAVVEELE